MSSLQKVRGLIGLLLCLTFLTFAGWEWTKGIAIAQTTSSQNDSSAAIGAVSLQADVAHLKDSLPPQSHPMVDVGYHAVNLWFAAGRKNWPLATYYLNETRNRIAWAVRMSPSVKGPTGPVDVKGIADSLDHGTFDVIKDTLDKKDGVRFVAAYKHMLESCYSCHKAIGRPYLRPMVPVTPQQPIINFDPAATWP